MARVVFVHGVGKQYLSEDSLVRDIVPELRGGVRLAGAGTRAAVPDPEDIAVAFYGDLFRPAGTRADSESFQAADVESDLEFELLMAWWAEAARTDRRVPAPDETGTRGAVGWAAAQGLRLKTVRRALDALTGAEFLGGVRDRVLIGNLKQVVRYLTDPDVRTRAQAQVAAHLTPDTRVVVGHSLGSVLAYEALCAAAERGEELDVRMLVTLGSPLGMRGVVLNRLHPAPVEGRAVWPENLRAWTNVADSKDIVAVVRELSPAFGPGVTDQVVHNGSHMHDATRYLTAVETGRAIAEGLSGTADE
ncbi:antibiotic ABC transporter ATP-binding protein [Streptomyces sp. NPDC006645]|uniref:antibiotic ABC transporter ATP-binding protein n=1 Tax=unclassified Streptomyces TaxID=2593676 RepID=UPI0033BC489E